MKLVWKGDRLSVILGDVGLIEHGVPFEVEDEELATRILATVESVERVDDDPKPRKAGKKE